MVHTKQAQKKLSYWTIFLAIIGLLSSLYALIIHIEILIQPGQGALCDINSTIQCSNVIGSKYGEFAAIPLGSYGMAFFIVLLCAACVHKYANVSKRWLAGLEVILASVGLLGVLSFMYISYFILKDICPVCTVIHVVTILYFLTKFNGYFSSRRLSSGYTSPDSFQRFFIFAIILSIPPLVAGLIAPVVVKKFSSPKSNSTTNTSQTIKNLNTNSSPKNELKTIQQELLNFNKTNFVGSGEDYRKGSDSARVIIQDFSDFGCPHCKESIKEMELAQNIVGRDKVLIIYRFFPLSNICNPYVQSAGFYPYSCLLAEASRCAGEQAKFWEFNDWAFSAQEWSDSDRKEKLSTEGLLAKATALGLNLNSFKSCLSSHVELKKIQEDASLANKLNIEGTPAIFINGIQYQGEHSSAAFVRAFEQSAQGN